MITKLEEIKRKGAYAIQLWFGEDVGCDDLDIPTIERKIIVMWRPVGHLGEIQSMYKGSVGSFLSFDVNSEPTIIGNPPQEEKYKESGYYMWGTERSMKPFLEKTNKA